MARARTAQSAGGGAADTVAAAAPVGRSIGLKTVLAVLVVLLAAYLYPQLTAVPSPPALGDRWWSRAAPPAAPDTAVRPFTVTAPPDTMDDIKARLTRAEKHLVPPLEGANFTYGFNTDFLKQVLSHWRTKYDWKRRLRAMNELPHFKTNIEGLDMHFVHVKPKLPGDKQYQVEPLLLLHGWPGSFVEFREAIKLLTQPRPGHRVVFEIICPSLPGYGFSSAAERPGLGAPEVASVMRKLMLRLGFQRFFVQGGDWGSAIGSHMATLYPENVRGLHINMATPGLSLRSWALLAAGRLFPSLVGSEFFQQRLYPVGGWVSLLLRETGYMHLQATKPDTVGVALGDSPAGLAAYILEKFSSWTDMAHVARPDGGLPGAFSLDDLLDNVMVYWVSGSITSSLRLYAESLGPRVSAMRLHEIPCRAPVGLLFAANEPFLFAPRLLGGKYPHVVSSRELQEGGHFLAMEKPQQLVEHVFVTVKAALEWEQQQQQQTQTQETPEEQVKQEKQKQ